VDPFSLCAIGAVVGFLASYVVPGEGRIMRIEAVLVGVFGAFIGGDFVPAMLAATPAAKPAFSVAGMGAAILGAVAGIAVLVVMRKVVGPMRAGKSAVRRR
jgi:uncharacterized membrane protein YeaQ/YmgE (transglycosylase-associated protein family)